MENSKMTVAAKTSEDQRMEWRIHSILQDLGMPCHIMGYRFTAYAIQLCVKDESLLDAITKGLYPTVAAKFDSTPSRVERGIRHAIDVTFLRGDLEVQAKYFGATVNPSKGKPTNAEFLAALVTHIKLDLDVAH